MRGSPNANRALRIAALVLILAGRFAISAEPRRDELLVRVRVADEFLRFCEEQVNTTPPGRFSMPYDQAIETWLKESSGLPPDADLDSLTDFELSHALANLRLRGIELYIEIARKAARDPQDLVAALRKFRESTMPRRSAILQRYIAPPPPPQTPEEAMMLAAKSAAASMDELESSMSSGMTPQEAVAEALAGRPMRKGPPAPSTVAPLDARAAVSFPLLQINPRSFAMSSDMPDRLPFRADPPGNPADAIPSRENIMRLMSAAGLSPQQAEEVASGRMTIDEARRGSGGEISQSTIMSSSDPRWQAFYYGPSDARNAWRSPAAGFDFEAGGGLYLRSDRRVNTDYDSRTNGEIDRRVNSSNDRRLNVQVDPRVNY